MRICFHGTNEENADGIPIKGFRPGTYSALHLEDAPESGGDYVSRVGFDEGRFNGTPDWQFHLREWVPPERIRRLERYSRTSIDHADSWRIWSA